MMQSFESVEKYISSFPKETQLILRNIRKIVKENAPHADEMVRYGMPAYKMNGKPLVYFAGYKNHIGLYPVPSGITAFKKELSGYKQGKGSVQFPLNQAIPYDLITKIVKYRVNEGSGSYKS